MRWRVETHDPVGGRQAGFQRGWSRHVWLSKASVYFPEALPDDFSASSVVLLDRLVLVALESLADQVVAVEEAHLVSGGYSSVKAVGRGLH